MASLKPSIIIGVVLALAAAGAVVAFLIHDPLGERGSGLTDEFKYKTDEYREIDPKLVLYEETAAIATGFSNPRGIAVGIEDRIYVAGDRGFRVFSPSGGLIAEVAAGAEPVGEPVCCAAADDGTVYLGFPGHIEVYDPSGKRTRRLEMPGPRTPRVTSIAVAEDVIFVADAANRVVLSYGGSGELLRRIGEPDKDRDIPGLVIPSPYFDIAVAADGLLRVANPGRQQIEAYTRDGDREFAWGEPGSSIDKFCGCCNPAHFAILRGGGFVTSEKGIPRVKIYDRGGDFQGVVAGPDLFPGEEIVLDVAADSRGRILILDPESRAVRVFTRIAGSERS